VTSGTIAVSAPVVGLVYLPVLAWAAVGVGLLVTYRRSTSTVIFRLAAAFVGFWAVFATTGLVWVLANGGWSAVVRLASAPTTIFEPRFLPLWLLGAAGAFAIFLTAFLLNQAVGRGLIVLLRPRPFAWPARIAVPEAPVDLLAFPSARVDAFCFTLLEFGGRAILRRREMVLLSDGLIAHLTPEEVEAVVAHELAHVRDLDGRYLTFFRTLARLMRWDPVLAYFADRLTSREEVRADLQAVELTRRPRALARALYKAIDLGGAPVLGAASFLGPGGRRGRQQAIERIRRLVSLAESGRFPEERAA
jgi:Zn-dependent protease with chaperone function